MNSIIKFGGALALIAMLAAPAAALAYYPYTYFTGPDYFNAGGGFGVGANYYGSSNCNAEYGCGTIGYDAMTGQWYNYGQGSGNYGMPGYTAWGMGYGSNGSIGGCYSCGLSQYLPMQLNNYGYGGGYTSMMGGMGSGYGGGYYGGYVY